MGFNGGTNKRHPGAMHGRGWIRGLKTNMSTIYRVSGMTCEGCAKSITGAIQRVAPETKVDVDLDAKTVTVNGFDDSAAIGRAIIGAGFDLAGAV
jgi:copper chaperone